MAGIFVLADALVRLVRMYSIFTVRLPSVHVYLCWFFFFWGGGKVKPITLNIIK